MTDFIQEIRNRRVLPAVGVYAAGCWVLIEILDRLVERYLLSPYITDAAFWGLYSLIPAVILVAWSHGKPGKDRTTVAEKVGVPINLIATVGLLITVFGGKDLGATANILTIANEEGVQETHYVPNESFRRRMAVFFFENKSSNAEMDWLQYGVTELLVQDLQQNPFVLATSPWANFGNGFYARMRAAGFNDGLSIPRSLMREIADDANRQYFVEGSVDDKAGQYELTVRIWETQTMKQVTELSRTGFDLYGVVDRIAEDLLEAMHVPVGGGKMSEDLPLSETYGESEEALRAYIAGMNERLFSNDVGASNALLDQALEADPGFVLAWFVKAINLLESGDIPSAQVALGKAQELDYRLPAVDRAMLKQINYRLSGQQDKLIKFLRLQVQLRGDASSHGTLATMLMVTGELDEAKEQFLQALERDPLNLAIYRQLATLERATGNLEAAVDYARRYQEEKPEEADVHLVLGDLLRDQGDLDAALEHYLKASFLADESVNAYLRMADIAARRGKSGEARNLLQQADDSTRVPLNKGLVRQSAALLENRLGRNRAAIEQFYRLEEYLIQSVAPYQVALSTYMPIANLYVELGELAQAQAAVDQAEGMMQPPLDQFLGFAQASILIEQGRLDEAEQALARAEATIDQFKIEDMRSQVDMVRAYIALQREEFKDSVQLFESAHHRAEKSVLTGEAFTLLPTLDALTANAMVRAGDLVRAETILNRGFGLDPSHPVLWLVRARQQQAVGAPELALASVNYALAIWKDADPEYRYYRQALELAAEIEASL